MSDVRVTEIVAEMTFMGSLTEELVDWADRHPGVALFATFATGWSSWSDRA